MKQAIHDLKERVGWRIYGSFLLVFSILCLLSFFSYQNAKKLIFDIEAVDATSAFMHEVQSLTTALRDAEMANNIYVLVGKGRFLDIYKQNVNLLQSQLKKVQNLQPTVKNSNLEKLIQLKIDDMSLTVSERETHNLNHALQVILTGKWQSISQQIQKNIELIERNQKNILDRQIKNKRRSTNETIFSTIMTSLAAFVLFIFASLIIRHDIISRLNYERLLKQARTEALQASEFKSQFLANMSHEIRTPMNGIMGMTTVLLDSTLDNKQTKYAETIQRSCEALLRIVNDILDFSKVEAGKLEICPEKFDIKLLLNELESLFLNITRKKGINLNFQIDTQLPPLVVGDSGRIRQIFNNLISNAVKFTEKGTVTIHCTLISKTNNKCKIRFEVCDTGIGIPLTSQEKIFGAFQQAESTTEKRFGGTGLGLNISKKLIELMRGKIGFTSEPGKGSQFWFELEFVGILESKAPKNTVVLNPALSSPVLRALVAEDDPINQDVIVNYLKKLNIQAEVVKNGQEAVSQFKSGIYDFLFFDFQMPILNGLEALHRIRKYEKENKKTLTPAFLVTANLNERVAQDLSSIEHSSLIYKPLQFEHFKTAIQEILAKKMETLQLSKFKVLVAEDNEINQDILRLFLPSDTFSLDCVLEGKTAVDLFKTHQYDLVLMDVQMPTMDGLEATRLIRAWEKQQNLIPAPILAFTGGVTPEELRKCKDSGCDGYIEKPIQKEKLLKSIADQLRHPGNKKQIA
ncbi:MAG: response regulator [Bdellovibrionales bacterium]